jgi:hypothetical protein
VDREEALMKKLTDDQAALLSRLAAILDRQDPERVEALEEPAADILDPSHLSLDDHPEVDHVGNEVARAGRQARARKRSR